MSEEKQNDSKKGGLKNRIETSLLDDRRVFLWGQVDDDSAKHIIDRLMYLDLENPGEEIKLFINSPGGYVTSGMAMYDTMMAIKSPVSTICMGLAASMGSVLLCAGEKGRRFIYPHGKVMIHQPSGGARGVSTDIETQAREILKTRQVIAEIYEKHCSQPTEKVMEDFDRDYWMTDEESVEYGIVDAVWKG